MSVLSEAVHLFAWRLHAYVLMGNHYHLLVETPDANLSRGMHRVNAIYSQAFNRRHERVGHLLQGRFKAILVEKERHLLELVRYVVLNPVRAGLSRDPEGWPWSNYLATAGLREAPEWLETEWTIDQFGNGVEARSAYREFVIAGTRGLDKPWTRVTNQLFLGSEDFRRRVRAIRVDRPLSVEVPRAQRSAIRPDMPEIVRAAASVLAVDPSEIRRQRRSPLRLSVAYIGRMDGLAQLPELGAALGVADSSASEIVASARRLRRQEPAFRALLRRIRAEIRRNQT